jgi:chromosome segregation ATPase
MEAIFALFRDPLFVVLLAILVFIGRVIFLAKRLKSAARNPTLLDLRALEEAKRALDKHHESLDDAKRTLDETIEGARDSLRGYKKPLARAVNGRRKGLESEMRSLEHFDEHLEAARSVKRRTLEGAKHQTAFEDAKKLYKKTRPGEGRRARKPSKDM